MSTVMAERTGTRWHRAARLADLDTVSHKTVTLDGHVILLWRDGGEVFAVDNRCPHMGFPLERGTCAGGLLTCHWHQARFDLRTGGTFDPWADDVPAFSVEVRGDEIWVDTAPKRDTRAYYEARLRDGLEQNIRLVLAKSAIALLDAGVEPTAPLGVALDFGVRNRSQGWGSGLTMLACFARLLPYLDAEDRPHALFQGLDAVSRDTAGSAPHFQLRPLPGATPDFPVLKQWFRQFLAVRDSEAAQRAVVTAIRAGCSQVQLAEMLFAAASDYRYLDGSHALDFTNRAFDSLDIAGWPPDLSEAVLASVVPNIAAGSRQEESNSWRHPVDLVALLEAAYIRLPEAAREGQPGRGTWHGQQALARKLLDDDPQGNLDALLGALAGGAAPDQIGEAVVLAAALRVAAFHLSNEFGDWDTVHHTFTYANGVHMGLRRLAGGSEEGQLELLRAAFDAAMSVYLDRFLNIPAAPLPRGRGPAAIDDLLPLLDQRQQVNEAAEVVSGCVNAGIVPERLQAVLGKALLREDRDFHTIQNMEAALNQYRLQGDPVFLVAAARYLAAHSATPRAQAQSYTIALRLHRGERLFEDAEA